MSAAHLALVAPTFHRPEHSSTAERIERLRAEAKALAREHMEALGAALEEVSCLAHEVVEAGDVYPVGAREMARQLADVADRQALGLTAILARA